MKNWIALFLLIAAPLIGGNFESPVSAKAVSDTAVIESAKPFYLGVQLTMKPGWHTYGENPGEAGLPTEISWDLPEGFSASGIRWPEPETFDTQGIIGYGYSKEVVLYVEITPPTNLESGTNIVFKGLVSWIACANECVPGKQKVELTLPVATGPPHVNSATAIPLPDTTLLWSLVLAFLGGIILNLMPCVLPVVSIKILGFMHLAGGKRGKVVTHALAYTTGVLVCFWILAGILISLRTAGEAAGWGFHLASPTFVAALIAILFVLGLSLFGVMELSLPFALGDGRFRGGSPLVTSFGAGLLTTLLATPCTGPFLGPVIGYAATLSVSSALAIFTAMGLGLASPYLVIAIFPALLSYLPKPGPWMERFKHTMGFLMMASALLLLWVFEALTDVDRLFLLMGGLLMLAVACWTRGIARWAYFLVALALMSGYGFSSNKWLEFTPSRVEELVAKNKPVFIDFTAKWCATCQVNKATLRSEAIRKAFESRGVITMEADWTKQDPIITEWLARFGRNGVPLYVLYGSDGKPHILPQTLTPDVVRAYLDDYVH